MNQKKACLYVQDKVFLKNKVFNSIEDDPNKKKFPNLKKVHKDITKVDISLFP